MKSKKFVLILLVVGMVFSSACFATNLVGQAVEEKADELTNKLSEELADGLQLTMESVTGVSMEDLQLTLQSTTGISMEDLELTQTAFGELSAEDIQATVNSLVSMDEGAIRKEFVLPDGAMNITQIEDMVNFQVNQPMLEMIDFYRSELNLQGLQEKEINTSITDVTASLVFTGHPSGKNLVVQMVALNPDLTNVSIRLEAE